MPSHRPFAATVAVGLVLILPLAASSSRAHAAEPHVSLRLSYKSETGRDGGDRLTRHASPFIEGRARGSEQVEVLEGDRVVGTATADKRGEWRARLSALPDGRHVLHARIRVDGEAVLSRQMAFVVDTVPPKPPTLRLSAGADTGSSDSDGRTRYRRLPIEGRADAQTTTILVRSRSRYVGGVTDVQRAWRIQTDKLRPGPVTLTAVARDAAGNESPPSVPLDIEIVEQRAYVDLRSLDGSDGVSLWAPSFGSGCYTARDEFGAADLNGDGRGDVVLRGTWLRDGARSRQVMFGAMGTDVPTSGKVDVQTLPVGEGFGVVAGERAGLVDGSVVGAGDVDGDGIGDFAVLAEITTGGSRRNLSRLTVVYGSKAGYPPSFDLRDIGPAEGFHVVGGDSDGPFGPLLGIGDFNGDGLGDLLFRREKLLQVLFGETGRRRDVIRLPRLARHDGVAFRLPSGSARLSFAHGDVNGDGLSDILVGRAGKGAGGTVSVVHGRSRFPADAALDEVADVLLTGAADDYEAPRMASGFDLDGDEKDEIAVLAEHDVTFDFEGKGFVVFGRAMKSPPVDLRSALDPDVAFHLTAPFIYHLDLQAVASAGDVNGDGFDDLVLSTDDGGLEGFVVYGRKLAFPEEFDLTALDGAEGYRLEINPRPLNSEDHCSVGSAGDFNGDGVGDVLISGATDRHMSEPGAAAYVVFGRRE